MQEPYREGLANRPGPKPGEGSRKAALEALDRGICRLAIELRNRVFRDAYGVGRPEGHTPVHQKRECAGGPAESQTPGRLRNSVRENYTPWPRAPSVQRSAWRSWLSPCAAWGAAALSNSSIRASTSYWSLPAESAARGGIQQGKVER